MTSPATPPAAAGTLSRPRVSARISSIAESATLAADAKAKAVALAKDYRPPESAPIALPGPSGRPSKVSIIARIMNPSDETAGRPGARASATSSAKPARRRSPTP